MVTVVATLVAGLVQAGPVIPAEHPDFEGADRLHRAPSADTAPDDACLLAYAEAHGCSALSGPSNHDHPEDLRPALKAQSVERASHLAFDLGRQLIDPVPARSTTFDDHPLLRLTDPAFAGAMHDASAAMAGFARQGPRAAAGQRPPPDAAEDAPLAEPDDAPDSETLTMLGAGQFGATLLGLGVVSQSGGSSSGRSGSSRPRTGSSRRGTGRSRRRG